MSGVMVVHVFAAGLWLGCILVEAFFERMLAGRDEFRLELAKLHRNVDTFVELPAIIMVLASGGLLYAAAAPSVAFHLMTGFGLVAAAANFYCAILVRRRFASARAGDWKGYQRADARHTNIGVIAVTAILAAAVAGLWNAF